MLWLYISALAVLVGSEMNAEIEHASPYGKEPGEKVPGQKRRIGPAAMRDWIAKRRQRGEKPPSADEVKEATERRPAAARPLTPAPVTMQAAVAPKPRSGGGDWLLAIPVAVAQVWMTLKALRKTRS